MGFNVRHRRPPESIAAGGSPRHRNPAADSVSAYGDDSSSSHSYAHAQAQAGAAATTTSDGGDAPHARKKKTHKNAMRRGVHKLNKRMLSATGLDLVGGSCGYSYSGSGNGGGTGTGTGAASDVVARPRSQSRMVVRGGDGVSSASSSSGMVSK
jgi:hypothetical protein